MRVRIYSEFFEAWLSIEVDETTSLGDALRKAENNTAVVLVDNQATIYEEFCSLDEWVKDRATVGDIEHFLRGAT